MKRFSLEVCNRTIVVEVVDGGGQISSDLGGYELDHDWLAAVDVLESLVLSHACAGVDVGAPAYLAGLKDAVETLANKLT